MGLTYVLELLTGLSCVQADRISAGVWPDAEAYAKSVETVYTVQKVKRV